MDLRSRSLRQNSAKKATTTQDLSTADDLKSDDEDYLSTEESTSSRSTTSPEDDTSILGQEEAAIVNIGSTPAGISPALTPALALAHTNNHNNCPSSFLSQCPVQRYYHYRRNPTLAPPDSQHLLMKTHPG